MSKEFDIAIVGAGPAGSSAAIRLAAAGRKVVLFEQKKFPRAKLCGEFVSPECIEHLEELGVMPSIRATDPPPIDKTVFYSRSGRSVEIASEWFGNDAVNALGISRAELDDQLLRRARGVGTDVREEVSVTAPILDGDRVVGVRARSENGECDVFANLTIGATGRPRAVAKHLDKSRDLIKPDHVAFKAHFRGAAIAEGACEIFAYPGGYGGCNAVEDDLFNLCFIASAKDVRRCSSDPMRVLNEIVLKNRRAARVLADASPASEWLAVPIMRFGRNDLVPAEGLLTIGDAASFIDPFTGSGILMALESSRLVALAITQNAAEAIANEYRRAYADAFDRRSRVSSILRRAAYVPAIADATIAVLSVSSFLRRRLAKATRGGGEKFDSIRT